MRSSFLSAAGQIKRAERRCTWPEAHTGRPENNGPTWISVVLPDIVAPSVLHEAIGYPSAHARPRLRARHTVAIGIDTVPLGIEPVLKPWWLQACSEVE
jgi:hypothetical protein